MEPLRPAEAAIIRHCAADPFAMSLVPKDPSWDVPHRLLAAVQLLILRGVVADHRNQSDSWQAFRSVLQGHCDWIADFVASRTTQTNEPQRCFALLPVFLTVARVSGKPLDLLELGTSGGINLFWDRHRYRYRDGAWGDDSAALGLIGEEAPDAGVPADLLHQQVEVRRRRGIDLHPVDVGTDEGVRLLESFLLGDAVRADRLRKAAAVVRRERPELIRGDYLELLPDLLKDRDDGALTVVFQTISTIYMPFELRRRLGALVESAGAAMPLAWISTPTPEEHGERRGNYPLELTIWPGGVKRTVARMSNSGNWLEWLG
jgi:hypothetical protein